MSWMRRQIVIAALMGLLATGGSVVIATTAYGYTTTRESSHGFNDQYVYATTRDLNNMEGVPAGLKLTLFPVTIVLDTVLLPFAVIAGFVT